MPCRLATGVQVRRESWGLLFYHQSRHKVCFVRSRGWLSPAHFDGTWTLESIAGDITRRTGTSSEKIERALPRLTEQLSHSGMLADEIR
ncbi:MAG: hypothetical protein ABR886_10860 [Dehalococcoidales bacterium]|jgi:putative mycofactocin binding protein MftB